MFLPRKQAEPDDLPSEAGNSHASLKSEIADYDQRLSAKEIHLNRPALAHTRCSLADSLFVLAAEEQGSEELAKPRLGVMIEETHAGVRVLDVIDGSVAEATGLLPGDIIVSAAGTLVSEIAELIEIIQRQAPGTLLPLVIRRDGETLNLVAEFPTEFE